MDFRNMISQTPTGKQLSEYQLNLLSKNNIETLFDFHETTEKKLHELLAIPKESVLELKKELADLWLRQSQADGPPEVEYGTGMEELDKLLDSVDQPFKSGRIWELCGHPGTGKTLFMYTLVLNFVWKHSQQVLFIDTKSDFSCKRIQDLLLARNWDAATCERVMRAIHVVQAPTDTVLINVLKTLDEQLTAQVDEALKTKLVVIDSLVPCYVHYRGDEMFKVRQALLTELACRIRKLAARGLASVIGNVSFPSEDKGKHTILFALNLFTTFVLTDDCMDDGEDDGNSDEKTARHKDGPMFGAYWASVCTLRMSLELPVGSDGEETSDRLGEATSSSCDDGLRLVNVLSNTYGPAGDSCLLRITEAGVV
ncbi:hypothetical protein KR059_005858 [Drosophila kikkawai]|nr:hypothetical protein KR059_005858 [Drosophila kikkawai]